MAKVAAVVESLEGVAEPMRPAYVQGDDGKFYLDVEGAPRGLVPADRVNEFRETNRKLAAESAALKAAFEGIDPAAAREALAQRQQLTDKELLKKGDVDTLITQRVQAAVTPLAQRLEQEAAARQKAEAALEAKVVDGNIVLAARAQGELNPGAEDFLVTKARAAGWTAVDGVLQQQANGAPVYSQTKPGQLRTIEEWIAEEALAQLSFAWRPSVGSGARAGVHPGSNQNVIDPNDRKAFEANLDAIASGKKQVGPLV